MAMKVMVAGDVEGSLTTLFKRVEAVDKKAGKCVFPPGPLLKSVFLPWFPSETILPWSCSEKCVSPLVLF